MTDLVWMYMNRLWQRFAPAFQPLLHGMRWMTAGILITGSLFSGNPAHATVPTVTTNAATAVSTSGATLNGTVNPQNRTTTVSFDYGLTTGYGTTVTLPTTLASGSGSTAVSTAISGLTCNTTYHFRASGDNSSGTTNGGDLSFTTSACVPAVPNAVTVAASSVGSTGATLNGTVVANGATTAVSFDYGLTVSYGTNVAATPASLTASYATNNVSTVLTGLTCGKTYHFRVNGVNSFGTDNGNDLTFTTSACVPTIIQFNSTGGTTATNGLHFYIEDSTKLQVKRLNNTGQVYSPTAVPTNSSLDNGVFLLANGLLYGPSHNVGGGFTPSGGAFDTVSLTAASPANPSTIGVQQTAVANVGIDSGPQVSIVWKYTTPLEFLTAEVTLTIPSGYPVTAANPVRYYHAVDTYLGGSDQGCGVKYTDTNGKAVVGTYPPTSGTTCLSSTSLPAGATIVESFRERSGTFSNYCAAGWSTFYSTGSPNCAVSQTAPMSNTITTTYQDTGVGIEYNFTAAGTYTFSYDFVIGTTVVPAYDHIEIQHDGSGALCPDNIKVLACTSSAVPCNVSDYVNTGTLTGTLFTTPATPAVTWSPSAAFSVGSSSSTADLTLTGVAPGGTYTLSASGMSATPLNGTKCYNTATATASCAFVVTNSSCSSPAANFNIVDSYYADKGYDSATDHRLYTKLAGWNESTSAAGDTVFKVDVVALKSDGTTETNYAGASASKNVTLEIFDDSSGTACNSSATNCSGCSKPVLATVNPVTFIVANSGYQNDVAVPLNNTNAYSRLIARVTDTNSSPTVYGCSTDAFSVRPQTIVVTATDSGGTAMVPSSSGAAGAVKVKAGAPFTMYADTGAVGYAGTPTINASLVTDFLGVATAPFAGSFGSANATTGQASGTAFTYGEVGYFVLAANAVYDAVFPVSSGDAINATTGVDCVSGSFSNTKTNGKYGCGIGSAGTSWGRFTPDHFDTLIVQSSGAPYLKPMACPTGVPSLTCPSNAVGANGMLYSGQDFTVQVMAKNSTGATTVNYAGGYAKAVTLSAVATNGGAAIPIAAPGGTLSGTSVGAASFSNGVNTVTPAIPIFTFTATPTVPTDVYIRAIDADSVSSLRAASAESGVKVASGRIKLPNVYGSELLTLPFAVTVQYYYGSGALTWVTSATDNITSFNSNLSTAGGNVVATVVTGLGSGLAVISPSISPVSAGVRTIILSSQGVSGNADLLINTPSYLSKSPGRATFGIFKSPLIYRRENY